MLKETSFTRTSSGIRNTHLFYTKEYIVIVEGDSDKPFWSVFFPNEVNGNKLKLKSVGGRLEVQSYIEELLQSKAKFAVAVDSDYRLLLNRLNKHSRIIETEYHSIENLMLSPSVIAEVIRTHSYDTEYEMFTVDKWLQHFDLATYPLLVAELIIEKNALGKQCAGDNCSRFLLKKSNPNFDDKKIQQRIEELNLSVKEFDEMEKKLETFKPRFHLRGHFFFSAVLCFISHEVKKIRQKSSISNDALYLALIASCKSRIEEDSMLKSIKKQAVLAAEELTNLLSEGI